MWSPLDEPNMWSFSKDSGRCVCDSFWDTAHQHCDGSTWELLFHPQGGEQNTVRCQDVSAMQFCKWTTHISFDKVWMQVRIAQDTKDAHAVIIIDREDFPGIERYLARQCFVYVYRMWNVSKLRTATNRSWFLHPTRSWFLLKLWALSVDPWRWNCGTQDFLNSAFSQHVCGAYEPCRICRIMNCRGNDSWTPGFGLHCREPGQHHCGWRWLWRWNSHSIGASKISKTICMMCEILTTLGLGPLISITISWLIGWPVEIFEILVSHHVAHGGFLLEPSKDATAWNKRPKCEWQFCSLL